MGKITHAGGDPEQDVTKVEERYSYKFLDTAATTTVKSGAGFLHAINVFNIGATGNSITVYDNTAGSGNKIAELNPPTAGAYIIDASFSTGLTVVLAGTTPPKGTFSYR